MKNVLYLLTLLGLMMGTLGLSSCGKMALPDRYEDSNYPRSYPRH